MWGFLAKQILTINVHLLHPKAFILFVQHFLRYRYATDDERAVSKLKYSCFYSYWSTGGVYVYAACVRF